MQVVNTIETRPGFRTGNGAAINFSLKTFKPWARCSGSALSKNVTRNMVGRL